MDQKTAQSIYGRGYEEGFQDGIQKMRRDGWRPVESPDELEEDDVVKITVAVASGYEGLCFVAEEPPMVRVVRCDKIQEPYYDSLGVDVANEIGVMWHELAKRYDIEL